jgi:hypothetical protein
MKILNKKKRNVNITILILGIVTFNLHNNNDDDNNNNNNNSERANVKTQKSRRRD